MEFFNAEVLVVGGGTGGTAAALQAARQGAQVTLVSEFGWLGGMLTSAGVAAPDGNELLAWQTGIWGDFLRELAQRQPGGLDNGWVSFFTYDPQVGAQIFADWVAALPNLRWIAGQTPTAVQRDGERVTGVTFQDYKIAAQITLDGTELGDLLALGDIPYRWGWEFQFEFGEPSAPIGPSDLTRTYPVQAPTWVVVLEDFEANFGEPAPLIPAPPNYDPSRFEGAWADHGGEAFLNYGRLPGNRFMINWPTHGNDYGEGVERLVGSPVDRAEFHQEARHHSQGFAHYIQTQLGDRYGLAVCTFPVTAPDQSAESTAFALHPYYRESRRLIGLTTVREQDLLPADGRSVTQVARLPLTWELNGHPEVNPCDSDVALICDAIAIGNYANDHHYPSGDIALAPKSIRWGGRWTGTPFTIPYRALVPLQIDGFLSCEKNISVTHMANGATRLQPLVLGIGQAAGMAAALCIEQGCQPRTLPVRALQTALLTDPTAPMAVIPLFNLIPSQHQWEEWQTVYLNHPDAYPTAGLAPNGPPTPHGNIKNNANILSGIFERRADQDFRLHTVTGSSWQLVTLDADINERLMKYPNQHPISVAGRENAAGEWFLTVQIALS